LLLLLLLGRTAGLCQPHSRKVLKLIAPRPCLLQE